jgi:membrane-associated phospholipid phosphatase
MDLLWQLEINLSLFFQGLGDWLITPFKAFTFLGNEIFFILFMPAVYWCVNSTHGLRMGVMLILSGQINTILKFAFHSPRPFWIDDRVNPLVTEASFGLPSGHAQNAASIWGALAVSAKHKTVTIITLVIIFFIGLSRLYLGVHFTRDVLLGWLIGALLVWIYFRLETSIKAWISPRTLGIQILYAFLFMAALVGIGLIVRALQSNWVLPEAWVQTALATGGEQPDPFSIDGLFSSAGVGFGFLAGFAWWVKNHGMLNAEGSFSKRILRYLIGIVGLAVFYFGLKLIFPVEPAMLGLVFRVIRYALIGVWVSAIAPIVFLKLKLTK